MLSFLYRYNRFTNSYLVNLNNFEFETEPELFSILQTYYSLKNISLTMQELVDKKISISEQNLLEIVHSLEEQAAEREPERKRRTFKLIDFAFFNRFLDHSKLSWALFLFVCYFALTQLFLVEKFFVLPKASEYSFSNIVLIIPIYYFSRFLFTPIHEFGHYFFYYLFTKRPASMYIHVPGIMYFSALTTTDDLFYIPQAYKRVVVSLAGLLFEGLLLALLLSVLAGKINSFYLQIITVRVFLSAVFNLNPLSTATDGHLLVTDLLGFTTFAETYSDYLRTLLNKSYTPSIVITSKVKKVLISYLFLSVGLIAVLLMTQIFFLQHVVSLLVTPLTHIEFTSQLGVVEYVFLILTYIYYGDILARLWAKRVIVTNLYKIRKGEIIAIEE